MGGQARRAGQRPVDSSPVAPEDFEDLTDEIIGVNGLREDTRETRLAQVVVRLVAANRYHRNRASTRRNLIDEPASVSARHRQVRHYYVAHHDLRQRLKRRGSGQHERPGHHQIRAQCLTRVVVIFDKQDANTAQRANGIFGHLPESTSPLV
jgi:hypothetical protein